MAPGHPREVGGGQGAGDRYLSGRFSSNVMLHGNHTCCASRSGQIEVGGPERKRTVVTVVLSPHSADDDQVEGGKEQCRRREITNSSVHEKKSRILSPYFQFPIASPPSFRALICIPRGTSPTPVFSLNTPKLLEIARKDKQVPDSLRKNIRIRDGLYRQ